MNGSLISVCAQCGAKLDDAPQHTSSCPSCNWRSAVKSVQEMHRATAVVGPVAMDPVRSVGAWGEMYRQMQQPDDDLARIRYFALLVGEDAGEVDRRLRPALAAGDAGPYLDELLRLAEKFLARIHEF